MQGIVTDHACTVIALLRPAVSGGLQTCCSVCYHPRQTALPYTLTPALLIRQALTEGQPQPLVMRSTSVSGASEASNPNRKSAFDPVSASLISITAYMAFAFLTTILSGSSVFIDVTSEPPTAPSVFLLMHDARANAGFVLENLASFPVSDISFGLAQPNRARTKIPDNRF
jgi:hypothetical protein